MRNVMAFAAVSVSALGGCAAVNGQLQDIGRYEPAAAYRNEIAEELPAFAHGPLTPPALREHVARLASDEFEGRAPGTRGEDLSVDYITRAFIAAGLNPGARDAHGAVSWAQNVPLVAATVTNAPTLTITGADGAQQAYAYESDIVVWTKRLDPQVALENAELVFVGYGIVNRELGWNDYAGVDMAGKIAVILINDPDFATGDNRGFRGRAMTYYGRWTYKLEEAARQGAAGALIIHETDAAAYGWGVVRSSWTGPQYDIERANRGQSRPLVEGWISSDAARQTFARAGLDFEAQRARAQRPDFTPTPLGLTASIAIDNQIETFASRNVVGVLRGRRRPDETLIYSAHWDHLGRCTPVNGDDICNGALDNASGVAGLIELARRFRSEGRPDRTIMFVAFTAEEAGLLGSAYYAEHPLVAPNRTVGMINMDGLSIAGTARDFVVIGAGQNDLETMLAEEARERRRVTVTETTPERGSYYRSDHFNLARLGVPALYTSAGLNLYDGGYTRGRTLANAYVAQRYHRPDDELTPQWDLTGAMRDLQLLHGVGRRVANSEVWPQWWPQNEFRAVREESMRPPAPPPESDPAPPAN